MLTNTTKSFSFNFKFLLLFILIFIIEVLIAIYLHDPIIRPFGGDVLVVILVYAFVRSFLNTNYKKIAVGVLLFAFVVEISQAFHFVKLLGLEHNTILRVALGSTFSYYDLLAYVIGYLICLQLK